MKRFDAEPGFTHVPWNGKDLLQCNQCAFNTMNGQRLMDDHIRLKHLAKANALRASRVLGPDGKPIVVSEGEGSRL